MDQDDSISMFFPGQEDVDLYDVLSLDKSASADDIKKAYRRLALKYHPDKHSSSSQETRADAATKFQQVGFAYTVLSDDKRRVKYDRTGRTDEGLALEAGEGGWEAYFEELFDRVTKGKLDEMKKSYQGSSEEVEDLKNAYVETGGSIEEIMKHVPHSTHEDEPRFIKVISQLIESGDLPKLPTWESSIGDEKARLVRKKQSQKEAAEAEELAKELGVWGEFYGSGKPGKRKGKAAASKDDDEDHSALQALILSKKKKMDGFLDNLAEKYAEPKSASKQKGKKRGAADASGSSKKSKVEEPPEIDDAEFEKLQQKLFGDKEKSTQAKPTRKSNRTQRSK